MALTVQDKLKYCYGAFALCIITSSVPQMTVQTFSMVFSIVMIIAFYIVRGRWGKESFEYKEASILIHTFWVWSGLYVGGIFIAGILISSFGDMTAINNWLESINQGGIPDEDSMRQVTQEYMDANFSLMITMTILSVLPAQIYAVWRGKQAFGRISNPPEPVADTIIE